MLKAIASDLDGTLLLHGAQALNPEIYDIILKFIEANGYQIIDNVRECYIDGCWNKEREEDYLTEIQFPVIKR